MVVVREQFRGSSQLPLVVDAYGLESVLVSADEVLNSGVLCTDVVGSVPITLISVHKLLDGPVSITAELSKSDMDEAAVLVDDETEDVVTTNAVLCIAEIGRLVVPLLIVDEVLSNTADEVGASPSLQAEAIIL